MPSVFIAEIANGRHSGLRLAARLSYTSVSQRCCTQASSQYSRVQRSEAASDASLAGSLFRCVAN